MNSFQARKNELLIESAINRKVLLLETARLKESTAWLKRDLLKGPWTVLAPAAGILLAWTLRRNPDLLSGSFSLLRKLWQACPGRPAPPK